MSYAVRADVEAEIPPPFVVAALDDDGDGVEDVGGWDAMAAAVDAEVDGFLGRRFPLPLETVPAMIRAGACVLVCEKLHGRRGAHGEKNPFTKRAGDFRKTLEAVASGGVALEVGRVAKRPPVSVISEAAGTVPRGRLNG